MAFISPYMVLKVWTSLTDAYDHEQLADNFLKLDQHDHTNGRGVQIPTAGIQDGAITALKLNPGISLSVPTGAVLPYGGLTAPTGYLLCDGSAVSRTTYANLFAIVAVRFGSGDGSTTFNLPSLASNVSLGTMSYIIKF